VTKFLTFADKNDKKKHKKLAFKMSEKGSKYSARNSVGWSRSSKFTGVVNVFVGILSYSPCIWFIQFWLMKVNKRILSSLPRCGIIFT